MNPILTQLITGAIDLVIGKVKAGEPVEAKDVVDAVIPQAAEAEKVIADNAKDVWLEELHNGGFLATSWRPLAALASIVGLAYEGMVIPLINTFAHVDYPPEYVSSAFLYTLLTLIGVRGIEKINIVRTRK